MAGSAKEVRKKTKANCTSVVTLHQGIFGARKPFVPLEQEKNSRLWYYALRKITIDEEYALPKGNHAFYTVYIHLTADDVRVLRAEQDWFSMMCGKVRELADCCSRGYYLTLTVDGTALVDASNAYVGANQESKASNTTSSFPGQGRIRRSVKSSDFKTEREYEIYMNHVSLYLAAVARHMDDKPVSDKIRDYEHKIKGNIGCEAVRTEEDDEELKVYHPGDKDAFPALEARVYDGRLPVLRDSITIKDYTPEQRDEQVECFGGFYEQASPVSPDEPPQLGGIVIGVPLCKSVASLRECETNSRCGLHRHGQVIMDPRTGEKLALPTPEHEEKLNKYANLLLGFYKQAARNDVNGCLESAHIPPRYGEKLVDKLTEMIEQEPHAAWRVFLKLKELGLDPTKLPRLVVSMGQHKAVCDAQSISPMEHVTNTGFKSTTMKYMDIDEQDLRMEKFLRNINRQIVINKKRIYKKLVSTDLSKCDSTIYTEDRVRFSGMTKTLNQVLRTEVADRYMAYQDALLSISKIVGKTKVWWHFKYFDVYMKCEQCPLGSGERQTSNLNRVTVMINGVAVWSAEIAEKDVQFVVAAWLSYDPDMDDGSVTLTNEQRSTLAGGYYTPHGDGAFDLCAGDGDDNALVVLSYEDLPRGRASKLVVDSFAEGHKIVEPAFEDEPQDRCELLSRYHVIINDTETLSYPKTKRLIQKLCMGMSDHVDYVFEGKIAVVNSGVAAEFATTMLQRAYQSKQHPVLRQLVLAVAGFWVDQALDGGKRYSAYSDDEQRKGILPEFDLRDRLDEMRDVIANQPMHYAEFAKTNDRKYANAKVYGSDPIDNEFRLIVEALITTDEEWRQMSIQKENIERPETFAMSYHCPEIIRPILGIDAWPSLPEAVGIRAGKPKLVPANLTTSTSLQSPAVLEPSGGCAQSHSRTIGSTDEMLFEPKLSKLQIDKYPAASGVLGGGTAVVHPARVIGVTGDSEGCAKPGVEERSLDGQTMNVTIPVGAGAIDIPNHMVHDRVTDGEVCDLKTVCMATGHPCRASSKSKDCAIPAISLPSTAGFEPPQKQEVGSDTISRDHVHLDSNGNGVALGLHRNTSEGKIGQFYVGVNSASAAGESAVGEQKLDGTTTVEGTAPLVSTEQEKSSSSQPSGSTPPGLELLKVSLERALSPISEGSDDEVPPSVIPLERPKTIKFVIWPYSESSESESEEWCGGFGEYEVEFDGGKYHAPSIVAKHADPNFKTLYCLIARATQPIECEALFRLWFETCGFDDKPYPGRSCFPKKVWRSYHTLMTNQQIIKRATVDSSVVFKLADPRNDLEASHSSGSNAVGVSQW
jgi:hypothetical protein